MSHDETTGLLTRETVIRGLDEALQTAAQQNNPVAVAALDIDHFRSLNVEHGSEFAEDLVKQIGQVLVKTFGAGCQIGRHTVDEFLVICQGPSAEHAFNLAESARQEVAALVLRPLNVEENYYVHPTVSAGVATYPADAATRSELLHKAAEALQRAKQTGKNQVCLAADTEMVPKNIRITKAQVAKLAELSASTGRPETLLLREALDDLFYKYSNHQRYETRPA